MVEFHDVDFRYPDAEEDMLHDVSFKADPGKVTAIIGSTGSGNPHSSTSCRAFSM